jgi:hypothetical protein
VKKGVQATLSNLYSGYFFSGNTGTFFTAGQVVSVHRTFVTAAFASPGAVIE